MSFIHYYMNLNPMYLSQTSFSSLAAFFFLFILERCQPKSVTESVCLICVSSVPAPPGCGELVVIGEGGGRGG